MNTTMIPIFSGYTGLVNAITCLALALFVLLRKPEEKLNRVFALWSFCVSLWSLNYFLWLFMYNHENALFWTRVSMTGAVLLPAAYFHFILIYLNLGHTRRPLKLLCYFISLAYVPLCFTPYFIKNLEPAFWFREWPVPGTLYHPFLVYFLAVISYVQVLLFKRAMSEATGLARRQFQLVALATLIAFIGGGSNFLLWYHIPIPPVLNFLVTGYVAFMAYAILHYRLWEIEAFTRRTIIFGGLSAFVFGVFSFGLFISQEVLSFFLGFRWEWALAVSIFLVVLGYEPMRAYLVEVTDKYLFQKDYDYKKLLRDASKGISQIESLHHLLGLVTHFLTMRMRLENAAVLRRDLKACTYQLGYLRGYPPGFKGRNVRLSSQEPLIRYLAKKGEGISIERIKGYIESGETEKGEKAASSEFDYRQIRLRMEELGAACCVPSFLGEDLRNILVLGRKKSGEYYSDDDLNLLSTISQESAIAIENARLYDEALHRTQELQKINEEVEKANKELRNAQAQLIHEQKMATLGRLAASVGHEVNNPLTILSMNVSRAILKYKKSPELKVVEILDLFQKMEQNIGRIKAVVNTLTGLLKKSEKGKFEPLSLKLILEETLPLVQFQTYLENTPGTEVEFDIPSDLPLIKGDLERLQEVFLNLFINAYHAMAGRRQPKITVKARAAGEDHKMIGIEFSDNGSGMPEDVQKKIFSYGYTTKGPGRGSGMGLYICKYIIELHGGEIRVKSQPGAGTTFSLTLPAYEETNPIGVPAGGAYQQ